MRRRAAFACAVLALAAGRGAAAAEPEKRLAATETELVAALLPVAAVGFSIEVEATSVFVIASVVDIHAPLRIAAFTAATIESDVGTAIVGTGTHRIIDVLEGAALTLRGLTLSGGVALGGDGAGGVSMEASLAQQLSLGGVEGLAGLGGCVLLHPGALSLRAEATTFSRCAAVHGGAIATLGRASTVTLAAGSRVVDSVAFVGAGVCVAAEGVVVSLVDSAFLRCHSFSAGGGVGFHHNLAGLGRLELAGSSFVGCTSDLVGACAATSFRGTTVASKTHFINSTAAFGAGGFFSYGGAGVDFGDVHFARCFSPQFAGAFIDTTSATDEIPSSSATVAFRAGSSVVHCGGGVVGGCAFDQARNAVVFEEGSSIRDCSAQRYGGGIALMRTVSLTFRGGAFISNCHAGDYGGGFGGNNQGATLLFTDASVSGCVAGGSGGGAFALTRRTLLFLVRCDLFNNHAPAGAGGAVAAAGARVWLQATIVRGNSARSGGAVAVDAAFNAAWDGNGGEEGRLFASSGTCGFISVLMDMTSNTQGSKKTFAVVVDALSGDARDARGRQNTARPVVGARVESLHCLAPGRTYRLVAASQDGRGWPRSFLNVQGLYDRLDPPDGADKFAVPQPAAESRFAVEHRFSTPASGGGPAVFQGNVAVSGGAVLLTGGAEAFIFQVLFVNNTVTGDAFEDHHGGGGGALSLARDVTLDAEACNFVRNSALHFGGAIRAASTTAVSLRRSTASENSAAEGGVAWFSHALRVDIDGIVFERNAALRSGGALAFVDVEDAVIRNSTFAGNAVRNGDGGAVWASGAGVVFHAARFLDNVATGGDGGGVACVADAHCAWASQEETACAAVDVVLDYTKSPEACGAGVPNDLNKLCDVLQTSCADPRLNDRFAGRPGCAGCACFDNEADEPIRFAKVVGAKGAVHFKDESTIYLATTLRPELGAAAGAVKVVPLCLVEGAYVLEAFDLLGEGFWGIDISVNVYSTPSTFTKHALAPWGGDRSSPLAFTVENQPQEQKHFFEGNEALDGGGGGVFWAEVTQPAGLGQVLAGLSQSANAAAFGPNAASAPAKLVVDAFAGDDDAAVNGTHFLDVALVDAYGHVVVTDELTVVVASVPTPPRILSKGRVRFEDYVLRPAAEGDAWANVVVKSPLLGLETFPAAVSCAPVHARRGDACVECLAGEFWTRDAAGEGHCHNCEAGMDCEGQDRVLSRVRAKAGWWRPDETSRRFFQCPFGGRGCRAGGGYGDEACFDGYRGPACGVCVRPQYFHDRTIQGCAKCRGMGPRYIAWLGGLSFSLVCFIAAAAWLRRDFRRGGKWSSRCGADMLKRSKWVDRCKVLCADVQIIASLSNTLGIGFPQPFRQLANLVALLTVDMSYLHLPLNCFFRFDLYSRVFAVTLGPFFAVVLILQRGARGERGDARTRRFAHHARLAFWVTFLLYAESSEASFAVFRFKHFGSAGCHLSADTSLRCFTRRHKAVMIYAAVMIFIIPAGVPLAFFILLSRSRHTISAASSSPLRPLFKRYRPEAYLFEVFECLRRVFTISVLSFFGPPRFVAVLGVAVSVCFAILHRDVMPFVDAGTNFLCVISKWAVVAVFYCMLIAVSHPIGYEDQGLGYAMMTFVAFAALVSAAVGLRDTRRAQETELKARELEFIIAESVPSAPETVDALRASTPRGARTLRSEIKLLAAMEAEDARSDDFAPSGVALAEARRPTFGEGGALSMHAASLHGSMHASVHSKGHPPHYRRCRSSFDAQSYPCFVVPVSAFARMDTLCSHEDALARDVLAVLTPESRAPNRAHSFFISQNWESPSQPDNACCTKLKWLRNLRKHLQIPEAFAEVWVWIDVCSVPQRDLRLQRSALRSLCYYSQLCSRFLPIVRDADAWRELYGDDVSAGPAGRRGTLGVYLSRGWCRVELMAGLAPKRLPSGAWQPGPRNLRFYYHHEPNCAGVGPLLTTRMLRNPLEGDFTSEGDRMALVPVVSDIAWRYKVYEASGADEWDSTIDVRARPAWFDTVRLPGAPRGSLRDMTPLRSTLFPNAQRSPRTAWRTFPELRGGLHRVHAAEIQEAKGDRPRRQTAPLNSRQYRHTVG
ncbi:hypothetical protein M885DRAFT_517315 [Pelagophyceae sp. CCMP2097]|nr:hypothetical protein M885DRAFT_517315 [Pelagophyceae sp. CCMP2097]